jgi:hypothetical protein
MIGFYSLCILLTVCLLVDADTTIRVITMASLKIQVYWVNWRMKCQARKIHRELTRMSKKAGWPEPPPFTFKNIWERD